jgi:hypothetical protein
MRRMANWAGTALAVTTAIVTAAVPAQAQTTPGWRVDKVFARPHPLDLQAVASSGADNAWMLGLVPDPEPTFVTQRWNGRRWAQVRLPARLSTVIGPWELYSNIYTTSPDNTWFFPVLPRNHTVPTQYALRWNGSAWKISEVTASPDTVLDAAVFSSRNVWAFGEAGASFPDYGPAVVRHWNGRAWQKVSMPLGTPVTVDGVAPSDIWALGVSKATVGDQHQTIIPMHWNGRAWSSPRLPVIKPVSKGHPWVATAISAAGPRDVWVSETPAVNQRTGTGPAGLILLHWNGSTWNTVARDMKLSSANGLTPDGHGGFWLTASDPANARGGLIVDYRHGHFTSQRAPGQPGYAGSASGIVRVPGTGSFWATGSLDSDKGSGNFESDILRYSS